MINVKTEELLPLNDVPQTIPGRRVSMPTIYRWSLHGVRGVKLETCVIGTARYTSREAIARFIEAQNTPGEVSSSNETPAEARKAKSAKVRGQAEKLGIA